MLRIQYELQDEKDLYSAELLADRLYEVAATTVRDNLALWLSDPDLHIPAKDQKKFAEAVFDAGRKYSGEKLWNEHFIICQDILLSILLNSPQ